MIEALAEMILWISQGSHLGRWIWPIIKLGVEEVKKEYGPSSFPIELQAATTEGSSTHIGTIYFLLLIVIWGMTAKGNESVPITF